MTKILRIKIVTFLILALVLGTLSFGPAHTPVARAEPGTIIYNLYATDSFISLADGTQAYIYGFVGGRQDAVINVQRSMAAKKNPGRIDVVTVPAPTPGPIAAGEAGLAGNAQFPAPVIYAAVGDTVEIRLKNLGVTQKSAPNDPHTIHLHGLDVNAANDGVPETSVAATPANGPDLGAGNVVVYMFSPSHAGTYMYHCHQEANIHVQMGMFGALVVYENRTDLAYLNGGPGKGFGGTLWGWGYDKDYILLLSEFDMGQHVGEQNAGARGAFNPVGFQPQYWFINGLSFPNTIHVGAPGFTWGDPAQTNCTNNALCWWINAHPNYDPLITGSVMVITGKTIPRRRC